MNASGKDSKLPAINVSGQSLARMIFRAELPEDQVRALPAQSLYLAVKQNGLLSSAEIVLIASPEQCRLMLDFDLWHADSFNEDNFWEWLALPDAEHDCNLALLQKMLRCIDLKLVGIILSRHVQIEIHEEPTDAAPGPGFHTPDRGRTWLHISTEDAQKHFLLGRFLALLYETNTEIFYQLIAVPGIETQSALEEEAFQEKSKRLAAEGVPDPEFAYALNSPLNEQQILRDLRNAAPRPAVESIEIVEPLLYQAVQLQPISSLLAEAGSPDEVRSELTLITNAAIMHFHADYCEIVQIVDLVARVRGALNIGLEALLLEERRGLREIYEILGLQKLYRFGLHKLALLRNLSLNVERRKSAATESDQILGAVLQGTCEKFPCQPAFFRPDGAIEGQGANLPGGTRAIETLQEYDSLTAFLKNKLD